jgi:hypothetical protein
LREVAEELTRCYLDVIEPDGFPLPCDFAEGDKEAAYQEDQKTIEKEFCQFLREWRRRLKGERCPSEPSWQVLAEIGFEPITDGNHSTAHRMVYSFGFLELAATAATTFLGAEVIQFSGALQSERKFGQIEFSLVNEFESSGQLKAFLAYYLSEYLPEACPEGAPLPEWFLQGLEDEDLLPWNKRQKEYESRPHCTVDRDLARLIRNRLKTLLKSATDKDVLQISFDGNCLCLTMREQELRVTAQGDEWKTTAQVAAAHLRKLPPRFTQPQVLIGIWQGNLEFANWRYPLIESPIV